MKVRNCKVFSVILAVIMVTAFLTCCGNREKLYKTASDQTQERSGDDQSDKKQNPSEGHIYRVGFINIDNTDENTYPAMTCFKEYVESDAFTESVGHSVEVITADSSKDVEKQTTNVEIMLSRGIDYLFIIGVNTAGNTTAVEMCNEEDVPVYMVGSEASDGDWNYVGFDEYDVGLRQGKWCVENLKRNANICYLEGTPGREAAIKRKQGFLDAIAKRNDLKVLSSQTGIFETAKAMQVTEDWIQAYGRQIDCIVAAADIMLDGAIEALVSAKMNDQVTTVGLAHVPGQAKGIKDGTKDYCVYVSWPGIGEFCGQLTEQLYKGEKVEDHYDIELQDLTIDTYDEVMSE